MKISYDSALYLRISLIIVALMWLCSCKAIIGKSTGGSVGVQGASCSIYENECMLFLSTTKTYYLEAMPDDGFEFVTWKGWPFCKENPVCELTLPDGLNTDLDLTLLLTPVFKLEEMNAQSLLSIENYIAGEMNLPDAPDYWEFRFNQLLKPTIGVSEVDGLSAIETELASEFNQFRFPQSEELRGFDCYYGLCYLLLIRDQSLVVLDTRENVIEFLGEIDTVAEAALVAVLNGYTIDAVNDNEYTVSETDSGFQLLVQKTINTCPIIDLDVFIHIDENANVTELGILNEQQYPVCN